MRISLSLIGLLYIIVVGGICHLMSIPEIVKAYLALPGLLIIPYLVGNTVLIISKKFLPDDYSYLDAIGKLILKWFIGFYFLIILFESMRFIYLYTDPILTPYSIVLIILVFGVFYENFIQHKLHKKGPRILKTFNHFGGIELIIISILISITISLFVKSFIKFQTIAKAWMVPTTLYTPVLRIVEDNYIFEPTMVRITDVISIYLTSSIFNSDPLSIIWSFGFIMLLILSVGMYLLVYEISKNKFQAILSVFLADLFFSRAGRLIGSGLAMDFTSSFFISAFFPLILFFIHHYIINNQRYSAENIFTLSKKIFIINLLFLIALNANIILSKLVQHDFEVNSLILFIFIIPLLLIIFRKSISLDMLVLFPIISFFYVSHIYSAFIGTFIICLYLFLYGLLHKKGKNNFNKNLVSNRYIYYILILFILFTSFYIIAQKIDIISFPPEIPEISDLLFKGVDEGLSFDTRYDIFVRIFGSTILSLLLIGLLFLHNKNIHFIVITSITSFIFFVYFIPDKLSYRIINYSFHFVPIFLSYVCLFIYRLFDKTFIKRKYLTPIYVLIILISISYYPISSAYEDIKRIELLDKKMDYHSEINYKEYAAANWLKENTPDNTVIISDFWSTNVISGLSKKLMIINPRITLAEQSQEGVNRLNYIKYNIFLSKDSNALYDAVKKILYPIYSTDIEYTKHKNISNFNCVILFTSKTSTWIRQKNLQFYYERQKVYSEDIDKFYNKTYFTLLYNDNDQIYIFGVNPEPGVPFKLVSNPKS